MSDFQRAKREPLNFEHMTSITVRANMGGMLKTCLIFWLGSVCGNAESVFQRVRELDDTSPANSQHFNNRMMDATPLQCSRQCLKLGWCLSFFYDASDRQCLLLDQFMSYEETTAGPLAVGNQYWEEQCPGFDGFLKGPDSPFCLLILRDLTYDEAMQACQLRRSQLIVLDSLDKLETVVNFLMDREEVVGPVSDQMFVDGRRAVNDTNVLGFEFSSGKVFPFDSDSSVWQSGQPNNLGMDQDCLALSHANAKNMDPLRLHDTACYNRRSCICERG